ncbi:molybdenum cofactor biosynthesis protein MoaE [Sphingobacteriales bacterium UPWRP_1]|nr:molybdopterin converting factor [Sphingobacteriales bacterium TSM_CSS]PSJ73048.1 molybdenum cofactor biosynthesis protein MoaE [Sphingobacteriales bacterium UPWRP_1]
MPEKKPKKVFVEGAISPQFIADSIAKHSSRTDIGAHSLFLGQVRADVIDQKQVTAIDYTAYTDMAEQILFTIREDTFAKYALTCMHIYHSLGRVLAGQISLFVFTSSVHRQAAVNACEELVERIKAEVPVWGKEIFDDNTTQWKKNTP